VSPRDFPQRRASILAAGLTSVPDPIDTLLAQVEDEPWRSWLERLLKLGDRGNLSGNASAGSRGVAEIE